jgi:hypothetical protein
MVGHIFYGYNGINSTTYDYWFTYFNNLFDTKLRRRDMEKNIKNNVMYLNLFVYNTRIGLTCSVKAYNRDLKKLGITEHNPLLGEGGIGTTNFIYKDKEDKNDLALLIIGIKESILKRKERGTIYGVIAHEAVHCFNGILKNIDEKKCGEEIYAYHIQSIVSFCVEEIEKVIK